MQKYPVCADEKYHRPVVTEKNKLVSDIRYFKAFLTLTKVNASKSIRSQQNII